MRIRPAHVLDAEAACALLRASITELCIADHRGEPARLGPWLANKTPAIVRTWIEAPDRTILVAEVDRRLLGVGGLCHRGEVTLNYVAPEARFSGVGTAMLVELEVRLIALGVAEIRLTSTATARHFYHGRGYRETSRSIAFAGMLDYHMTKQL